MPSRLPAFSRPCWRSTDLRIILTGAGSSAFIGECLAPLLLQQLGRRVEAIATTDLLSGPHAVFPARRAHAAGVLRPLRQQPRKRRGGGSGGTAAARMSSAGIHLQRTGNALPTLPRAAQQPRHSAAAGNARSEFRHDLELHGHDAGRLAGVPRPREAPTRGAARAGARAGARSRTQCDDADAGRRELFARGVSRQQRLQGAGARSRIETIGTDRRQGRRRLRFAAGLSPRTEDHRDRRHAAVRVRLQRSVHPPL